MLNQKFPIFQSTLPARGATLLFIRPMWISEFQSTLPARGATSDLETAISKFQFQSTLPARGATFQRVFNRV